MTASLPDVFHHDPAGWQRIPFPFPEAPADIAGAWWSRKGAPLAMRCVAYVAGSSGS